MSRKCPRGCVPAPLAQLGSTEEERRYRMSIGDEYRLPNIGNGMFPPDIMARLPWRGETMVTIYRSVPKGITEIRPGDWVALRRDYAAMHARGKMLSMAVPAMDIAWAGTDENEWFYVPAPQATLGAVRRKRPSCSWIQKELHSYLSTTIDPYDFTHYLPEWGEATGADLGEEPQVEDLSPAQLAAFTAWLQNEHKGSEYMEQDPYGSPPYLTLSSAGPAPAGTWLIHFTDEGPFHSFARGTKLYGLHLSTWAKSNATAACATNLSPDHGLFETVFGFAFAALERGVVRHGQKYGRNAVLFQCDCAVQAYHSGDEENQYIFPLCSEYNVVPFATDNNQLVGTTEAGDEVSFASPAEAIAHIQAHKGLGGLRGLGY